jgi:uncharacterized protein YcfL
MKKIFITSLCLLIITGCGSKKNNINNKTSLDENGKSNDEVVENDISFTNIELNYDGSITTLTANMQNNTNEVKNFTVTITLKDEKEKQVKSLKQIVENLESGKKQILQTGIVGDYSYIKNVEFTIEEVE